MKNIYILPTEKPTIPSRLFYKERELVFSKYYHVFNGVNIYITSDEEIKEEDVVKIPCGVGKVKKLNWKFGNDNPSYIVEDIFIYKLRYGQKEGELQINSFRYEDVKKIILTTDQDLIKEGVQPIDDEFLEWFVKNPSCESVEIIPLRKSSGWYDEKEIWHWDFLAYKIVIPKEESKQETLKEAAKRIVLETYGEIFSKHPRGGKLSNETIINILTVFFELGSKWQQEKSYSEEDMKQFGLYLGDNLKKLKGKTIDEIFEQFKKK